MSSLCLVVHTRSMWSKINHSFRWRHWQRWTWAIMEWLPFPDSLSPIWMSIKQFVISFLPNKFLSSSFFLVCHDRECDERIRFFPTLLIEIEHCVFVTGLSHSLSVDSSSWEIVFVCIYNSVDLIVSIFQTKFDAVGSEPQLLTRCDVGPRRWIVQPRVTGPDW